MILRTVCGLNNLVCRRNLILLNQKRFVTLQPTTAIPLDEQRPESFEQKNARLQRPLSPHLTIYKQPLSMVLSITHRITGCMLIGYVGLVASAGHLYEVPTLIELIKSFHLSPNTLLGIKFALAVPLNYHIVHGVRHLVWDYGFGYSIKSVYVAGLISLVLTLLLSVGLVMV